MGEAYPGSTGGEIFNYYETDGSANTASGNYSTTIGYNNKNDCATTLVAGASNHITTEGTDSRSNLIVGSNSAIEVQSGGSRYVIGSALIGSGNTISNDRYMSSIQSMILAGQGLQYSMSSTYTQMGGCVGVGKFNTDTFALSDPVFFIGCGTSGSRKNALEVNPYATKVLQSFELATDNTQVDAITPPPDPNNVTQDDKTLVTKTHVPAPLLTTATSLSENDPALDLSADWSNVRASDTNIRFYIRINGVCFESAICDCKNSDGYLEFERNAYDSNAQSTTVYEYKFSWDHTAKTLTYIELLSYDLADAGTISNVSHALSGATITVYRVETF